MIEMATGGRHPAIWTQVTSNTVIAAGVGGMQAGLPMAAALVVYNAPEGFPPGASLGWSTSESLLVRPTVIQASAFSSSFSK